jgi:hypothetical protein
MLHVDPKVPFVQRFKTFKGSTFKGWKKPLSVKLQARSEKEKKQRHATNPSNSSNPVNL